LNQALKAYVDMAVDKGMDEDTMLIRVPDMDEEEMEELADGDLEYPGHYLADVMTVSHLACVMAPSEPWRWPSSHF